MSVERPLWRALIGYRVLTLVYAVTLFGFEYDQYDHQRAAIAYLAVLAGWTFATLGRLRSREHCSRPFLAVDLALALTGVLLTPWVASAAHIQGGGPTLPSIWTGGSVLAFAIRDGWRWAAGTSALVGVANVIERGGIARDTLHNVLLVWIASIGIGYVVEVARASERVLARALRIEATTRERERLARSIHDSVLQVLAMVQRRGNEIGGEAEALGRMAGEQEAALRVLVASTPEAGAACDGAGLSPSPSAGPAAPVHPRTSSEANPVPLRPAPHGDRPQPVDLRTLLTPYGGPDVTVSAPGTPVLLDPYAAQELAAAVGAALDNVRRHAGDGARAWILVEDEPEAVLLSVRDNGPGIPEGRLADAEREGRLGVAQSIRGRLRDLGGTADLISSPGQGTEVELKIPRPKLPKQGEGTAPWPTTL
jgi:signal transduction histidine kinase